MDDEVVTTKELSDRLKISMAQIYQLRQEGLPRMQIGKRTCRYRVKDVEEFNNDRITGAYVIEKPLYDENDKRITNGVYKRYPRGINKTQDMIDDKEVNKS